MANGIFGDTNGQHGACDDLDDPEDRGDALWTVPVQNTVGTRRGFRSRFG